MVKHTRRKTVVISVPDNDSGPTIRVVTYLRETVNNKYGSTRSKWNSVTRKESCRAKDLKYSDI